MLFAKLIVLFCSLLTDSIQIDRESATEAFHYLNAFRAHPTEYGHKIGVNLSAVRPAIQLNWNDTLAIVAESKAMDMAKRNYFAHVDPDENGINYLMNKAHYNLPKAFLTHRTDNYFESICEGGANAIDCINLLIEDKGISGLGHRKHLLGIDYNKFSYPKNSEMVDVGIGYCLKTVNLKGHGSATKTYMCVIIASHKGFPELNKRKQ